MSRIVPLIFVALLMIPPALARANPSSSGEDRGDGSAHDEETDESAEEDGGNVPSIIPILTGERAPWSGLLVPEQTFTHYLELELKVDELQGILDVRTSLLQTQENIYEQALEDVGRIQEQSWWDEYKFTVGIVSGLVVGVVAVLLGAWLVG